MTSKERFEKWWDNPNTKKIFGEFAENHYSIPREQLREVAWIAFNTGYNFGYITGIE